MLSDGMEAGLGDAGAMGVEGTDVAKAVDCIVRPATFARSGGGIRRRSLRNIAGTRGRSRRCRRVTREKPASPVPIRGGRRARRRGNLRSRRVGNLHDTDMKQRHHIPFTRIDCGNFGELAENQQKRPGVDVWNLPVTCIVRGDALTLKGKFPFPCQVQGMSCK